MIKHNRSNSIFLVIAVALMLMITAFSDVYDSASKNGDSLSFNEGWYIESSDGERVMFNDFGKTLNQNSIELYHAHDDELNSIDALGFYNYYSEVEVFVGDEKIYSYVSDEKLRDRVLLGNYFSMIDIHSHELPESEFKVVFTNDGPLTVYGFTGGSGSAMEMKMIRSYIPVLIAPIMTLLFLMVTIILRLKKTTKDLLTDKHRWLLVFAFTISFWEVADTQMLMDLGMNAGRVCLLSFETFMILPVPMIMIFYNSCRIMKSWDKLLIGIVFCNFILVNIMSITGFKSMLDSQFMTHIVTGLAMVVILIQILLEHSHSKKYEVSMLFWGYVVFLVCTVMQYLNFFVNPSGNNSTILQLGVLIFILMQISTVLRTVNNRIHQITEKLETQTKLLSDTFRTFMPDELVSLAIENEGKIATTGKNKYLTVLECDIRGFSELVPEMSPEDAISMLNHYLETMTIIIKRHSGSVLDFVGDAIVAIFDEDRSGSNHSEKALFAAVEMQMCMEDIKQWNNKHGYPVFEMGIGINSGYSYVGYIGSDERMEYNAIGTTMNLVARIESYSTGGQILISEECRNNIQIDIDILDSFKILPKGYAREVKVYNIGGIGSPYNLNCAPTYAVPIAVEKPLEVTFNMIVHKQCSDEYYDALITELSDTSATMITEFPLKIFNDIRLNLNYAQSLSCKVISKSEKGYLIRCTSAPNGFSGWVKHETKEGN